MANTKKVLDEDVTKNPQAKTAEDVNNQDSRTRLWQSLNTTYGNQMEESDKAYDKAISQQDNAMLARGMGRSSYAGQIRAGMYNDKSTARNKLGQALIADYQNRIGEIEQQEKEDEWRQKQFDESQRQFNENLAYNREQNELNRAFQTSEREASQAYSTSERLAQQGYNTSEREAQQRYQAEQAQLNRDAEKALQLLNQEFQSKENALSRQAQKDLQILSQNWQSGENDKNRAAQEALTRLEQEFQSGENAKNRELQESLQKLSQAFTAEQNALNRQMESEQFNANLAFQQSEAARNQSNWEISQAFTEKQWEAQQAQWREEFDYNKMSTDQKLYYNYIIQAIKTRGKVSDELLQKAGISRQDYNAMIAQVTDANGNSGYTGNYTGSAPQKPSTNTSTSAYSYSDLLNDLNNGGSNNSGSTGNNNKTAIENLTNLINSKTSGANPGNSISTKDTLNAKLGLTNDNDKIYGPVDKTILDTWNTAMAPYGINKTSALQEDIDRINKQNKNDKIKNNGKD